jgi:hypothetical protein
MPCFKRGKSSKRKKYNLQDEVEKLEKKLDDLEGKMDMILEAIRHGRVTELKEIEETPNVEESVVEEMQSVNQQGNGTEQICNDDYVEETVAEQDESVNQHENQTEETSEDDYVEGTVVEKDESVNQQENQTEETSEDDYVEGTVVEQEDSVNEEANGTEQLGGDDYVEETVVEEAGSVNEQENLWEQIGEENGVEETVLTYVEGHKDEDSGKETVALSHQDMYKRRIRFIVIFLLLCALGMLLLWGVNRWGVCGWGLFTKWCNINAKIRLNGWLNSRWW